MPDIEPSPLPESIQTPTEASEGFLKRWGKDIWSGMYGAVTGILTLKTIELAYQGHISAAIGEGIAAGLASIATVGRIHSSRIGSNKTPTKHSQN